MSFQVANLESQSVPLIKELPVADGQSFVKGALLVESSGEWVEVSEDDYEEYGDVGLIEGVALHRYGVEGLVPFEGTPGFDITGGIGINPGRCLAAVVRQGDRTRLWSAEYVGTLPEVTGGTYGVVRGADLKWRVDFDSAGSVVLLESLAWTQDPLNKNRVIVSFVAVAEEEA